MNAAAYPETLTGMLRALCLPEMASSHEEMPARAEREGWGFTQYLRHLAERELEGRKRRRIERNLWQSKLPSEKTLATLKPARLPVKVRRVLAALCEGGFVERAENILAFGLPGRGKTHLLWLSSVDPGSVDLRVQPGCDLATHGEKAEEPTQMGNHMLERCSADPCSGHSNEGLDVSRRDLGET